jgi:hypothetical protein
MRSASSFGRAWTATGLLYRRVQSRSRRRLAPMSTITDASAAPPSS